MSKVPLYRFPGPTLQDRMVVTFNDFTTPFNPKALGSWLDSADESDTVRRLKQGAGCRVQGAGCRVQGAGCRVQGSWCRVQGPGWTRPTKENSCAGSI